MEEAKGLQIKFQHLMEDFCVPFNTSLVEDFKEIDFHDDSEVEDFLTQLALKQKLLTDKLTLLDAATGLIQKLQWIAKLDDPLETKVPFHYLRVATNAALPEIERQYTQITDKMRVYLKTHLCDCGVTRDLALCEKAFKRIQEIVAARKVMANRSCPRCLRKNCNCSTIVEMKQDGWQVIQVNQLWHIETPAHERYNVGYAEEARAWNFAVREYRKAQKTKET